MRFAIEATSGRARAGTLSMKRATVLTPAFMPVGTQAAVKALTADEVSQSGARLIIANTYHLMLRPGAERVASLGGLPAMMRWPHAIATDSGGFQAYSLAARTRVSEEGFEFASHLDGTRHLLTPEESMRIQALLGSDIAMQLDICPPAGTSPDELRAAVDRTTRWAERCLTQRSEGQAVFGIIQGGLNVALREEHAATLGELELDGLALGGFSVGESNAAMHDVLAQVVPRVDPARPRYLMGVGSPADLVRAVSSGVDLFDCVMPTRNARNGQVFLGPRKIVIKNARYRDDPRVIDARCPCPTCRGQYSRAYIRHLFIAGEILAHRLLTIHNVWVYQRLVAQMRAAILDDRFDDWSREWWEGAI